MPVRLRCMRCCLLLRILFLATAWCCLQQLLQLPLACAAAIGTCCCSQYWICCCLSMLPLRMLLVAYAAPVAVVCAFVFARSFYCILSVACAAILLLFACDVVCCCIRCSIRLLHFLCCSHWRLLPPLSLHVLAAVKAAADLVLHMLFLVALHVLPPLTLIVHLVLRVLLYFCCHCCCISGAACAVGDCCICCSLPLLQ